jgi:hypothetical protein
MLHSLLAAIAAIAAPASAGGGVGIVRGVAAPAQVDLALAACIAATETGKVEPEALTRDGWVVERRMKQTDIYGRPDNSARILLIGALGDLCFVRAQLDGTEGVERVYALIDARMASGQSRSTSAGSRKWRAGNRLISLDPFVDPQEPSGTIQIITGRFPRESK